MVTLREPVSRAFSAYLFMLRQGRATGSFEDALARHPELVDHGRYGSLVSRVVHRFGRPRLFAGVFDDLADDPRGYTSQIAAFLGIDDLDPPPELLAPSLEAAAPRRAGPARIARRLGVTVRNAGGDAVVTRVKSSPAVARLLYRDYREGERPTLAADVASALRDQLRPEVLLLDEVLGTTCAQRWEYG
jgi:hypothetical protein